jgi:biopolymer transport protein ExbD
VNIAKAHQKARNAVKRRQEQIEQEELEGGEINLIPYLDIVTNLMLFLLASISAGLVLGQINTTLPDRGPAASDMSGDGAKPEDEKPLGLIVTVTKKDIIVWSTPPRYAEGSLQNPRATIKRLPPVVDERTGEADPVPVYDYRALNDAMYEIASRRWKGKSRVFATYRVTLQADDAIPYEAIVRTMDALRCKLPAAGAVETEVACALPRVAEGDDGKPVTGPDGHPLLIGADRKPLPTAYDPDTMALFHDIVFSPGRFQ